MPESEGKLLFAENLNLREGKLCSSEKPSVDLLESEDAGELGKTAFLLKTSI